VLDNAVFHPCLLLARPAIHSARGIRPDGELVELYAHVSSRPVIEDSVVQFTDYELDVVLQPGQTAQIVDEDEFAQASSITAIRPSSKRRVIRRRLKRWTRKRMGSRRLPRFERANLESVTVWDGKKRQCD